MAFRWWGVCDGCMRGKRGRAVGSDEGRLGWHPFPLLRLPGAWSHTTRFRVDGIKAISRGINLFKIQQPPPHNRPFAASYSRGINGHDGEQKSLWDKTNKGNYHLKLCIFSCLSCPRATFARSTPQPPLPPLAKALAWLAAKGLWPLFYVLLLEITSLLFDSNVLTVA